MNRRSTSLRATEASHTVDERTHLAREPHTASPGQAQGNVPQTPTRTPWQAMATQATRHGRSTTAGKPVCYSRQSRVVPHDPSSPALDSRPAAEAGGNDNRGPGIACSSPPEGDNEGSRQIPRVLCSPTTACDRSHSTAAGNGGTSHEVSAPFGEISAAIVNVSVCLTDTIRSQGFSPSQRLYPAGASWLCFTPLPPIGFTAFRAFPAMVSREASRLPMLSCRYRVRPMHSKLCSRPRPGFRALLQPGIRHPYRHD
jgi:hypothetical protein